MSGDRDQVTMHLLFRPLLGMRIWDGARMAQSNCNRRNVTQAVMHRPSIMIHFGLNRAAHDLISTVTTVLAEHEHH
jgi:hypothetical protein